MKIVTYDFEVTSHDWLCVFKDKESGQYTIVHNDGEQLKQCINDDTLYFGFNSKHYDQYIMKAAANGFSNEEVKQVNDFIIGGNLGFECPILKDVYFNFNNVDIRDDMQAGLSLKAIEGHLGLDITESTVSFDIDHPWTNDELNEMVYYCKKDVDATEKLIDIRKDYLKNKIAVGKIAGLTEPKSLSMTNGKLTAAMLKAEPKQHTDERSYTYPSNLLKEYIPKEVFDFFNRLSDESITYDEIFGKDKDNLEIMIGDCKIVLGFGGIHGAIPYYHWSKGNSDRIIKNKDVGSYYPHLMTINGYTSRNIPSPKTFENVLETRMKAKADGDKATANALKLVCNTTYGCLLNQYNALYDPLMGRSVCISGQLYLLELSEHLYSEIESLKIIQVNTDGIMVECDESDVKRLDEICDEWQKRTGFDLETDTVVAIHQKDVNNYIEVQGDGSFKKKGGYLVKGISTAGAFNINNNATIVSEALANYFLNGVQIEDTIESCNDPLKFQIIAKAGSKYKEAYHEVNGEKLPVQKVNRVYATNDESYGKIFKVKAVDDSEAMIASLPEHCFVDNKNEITIDKIDKSFYIKLAQKQLNHFYGIKEKKGKKNVEKKNVYSKLLEAREKFLEASVKKSGKNMHLQFMYFELDDIVPIATKIFKEIGLITLFNFSDNVATVTIVDTDNPKDFIVITAPFNQIKPIVSGTGKMATNEMQALGSSITYMRRYLYMIALDICEPDTIDSEIGSPAPKQESQKVNTVPTVSTAQTTQVASEQASAPKTEHARIPTPSATKREEIKNTLTAPSANASPLQIKSLKNALKTLREKHPEKDEMIARLAVETKGFTVISKADCEKIINSVTAMIKE